MTEAEIIEAISALPGVGVVTASKESGAPEVAWGDSFFSYDPEGIPENHRFPFATLVVKDYPGFDTESHVDRPGVYRLSLNVGRDRFTDLFGFPPAQFPEHRGEFDFAALDRVIPHPVYATQSWASVLVPGGESEKLARQLIVEAYERAKKRHRPPHEAIAP